MDAATTFTATERLVIILVTKLQLDSTKARLLCKDCSSTCEGIGPQRIYRIAFNEGHRTSVQISVIAASNPVSVSLAAVQSRGRPRARAGYKAN